MSEKIYFTKDNPVPEWLADQLTPVLQPIFDFNRRALPKEGIMKKHVEFSIEGDIFLDNVLGHTEFTGVLTLKHDGDVKMSVPVQGESHRE